MDVQALTTLGFLLITAGIILVAASLIFIASHGKNNEGKAKAGGAVIIGPFPIVFGTDKETLKIALVLSIILTVLLMVLTLFLRFLSK
jgi:uncharacterized protein (TIGR00304 family)